MVCCKNPQKIQNLFEEIAEYYDRMNNFISLGTHYFVKFLAIKELDIQPRTMVLDLCCGTGDFTKIISKCFPRAKVIGLDFSKNMIMIAKQKNPKGVFMQGDCTALPFGQEEFNYVTMGFGLRNIQNRGAALAEIYRVLQNGGKFLHLDFGMHNKISKVFDLTVLLFVKILKVDAEHYNYLLLSKNEFPQPDELVKEFASYGFRFVKRCDYLFGIISTQIFEK